MEDTQNTPNTQGTPPAASDTPQPGQAGQQPESVPYTRFKEINDGYQQLKRELDGIKANQKQADDAKLAEQGQFKDLLAQRDQELATEKATNLRLKVATVKQLPPELIDRLRGANEDELTRDADSLLALLKPKGGPGVPVPGGGGGGKPDIKTMTPAQIREARAKGLV